MFSLFSPNKAHISNKFEVQPYVFELAFTGLKSRVKGATRTSFCYQHAIPISIQVTLETEQWKS